MLKIVLHILSYANVSSPVGILRENQYAALSARSHLHVLMHHCVSFPGFNISEQK